MSVKWLYVCVFPRAL